MGRFITRDTWGGDTNKPLSYNQWVYGYANPINYTDPSGYWALTKDIELYPGGFYRYGILKVKGGFCPRGQVCYSPLSTMADIFVSQPVGNDIKYKVTQYPDIMDISQLLQGNFYNLINWVETIEGGRPNMGCVYPRRYPDTRIPVPFLNINWKHVETLHGFSEAFGKGQATVTSFAFTNSPDQTLDEMSVSGVPFLDPEMMKYRSYTYRPYTYGDHGSAGTYVQALDLAANVWMAKRNIVMREYWINIETNVSKPGLYRAQIITRKNNQSHYKLWIDAGGWHEKPFYDELSGSW